MTWIQLSFKEWQRRPLRTCISATGVAIAVAGLFSLLSFQRGYRDGIRSELDRLGAHILVVPKGCPYDAASIALHGASWPCYLKRSYLDEVRSVPGIAAAAPALMSMAKEGSAPGGHVETCYIGVETNILLLKRSWQITGRFPVGQNEVLAGSEAARKRGWHVGERTPLPGLTDKQGVVVGILGATQGAEDEFIYVRLADAQRIFSHSNELTHILVRLTDPNDLDKAVAQLRGCEAGLSMNVIPLTHLFQTIQKIVNSTQAILASVAVLALLIAGSGLSNTILMAVAERRREIGVMRALGAAPRQVFGVIWLEAAGICLVGAFAGSTLAFASSRAVEAWIRTTLPFAPAETLVRWEWPVAGFCVVCALVLGSIAALLPAARAATIPPAQSMRSR